MQFLIWLAAALWGRGAVAIILIAAAGGRIFGVEEEGAPKRIKRLDIPIPQSNVRQLLKRQQPKIE